MRTGKARQLICILAACAAVIAFPLVASAQEDDPLRLVHVDISDGEALDAYDRIHDMLDESPHIDPVDEAEFVEHARELGLDDDALHRDKRDDHEDDIAALMWHEEVEALLLHDIDDTGEELRLGVIGPLGWQLTEVEQPLTDGDLESADARAALETLFSDLVPEIRGFRRDVERGDLTDDDFELPEVEEEEEQEDLREAAAREHRAKYGDLGRQLDVRAGLMAGMRQMTLTGSEGDFELSHGTMLVGAGVRIDAMLATFDQSRAAMEVGGFMAGAPFTTIFEDNEFAGQFLRFGGEARYIGALSATTRYRVIGGAETTNLSLDPNDQYTGHGYLNARLGIGIHHTVADMVTLQADALFLPILSSSNSGEAYGETTGWLGLGVDVGAHLELFDPVLAGFHYSAAYQSLEHPEPEGMDGTADSGDMVHQTFFTVGYRL